MTTHHIEHSLRADDLREEGCDTLASCQVVADLTIAGERFQCVFQNDGDGALKFSNHEAGMDDQTEAIADALGIVEDGSLHHVARPLDHQVASALESVRAEAQSLFDSTFIEA